MLQPFDMKSLSNVADNISSTYTRDTLKADLAEDSKMAWTQNTANLAKEIALTSPAQHCQNLTSQRLKTQ